MRIAIVASEVTPWSKTGGLADVVAELPAALQEANGDVRAAVFAPLYRGAAGRALALGAVLRETGVSVRVPLAGRLEEGRFLAYRGPDGITVFFLEHSGFYDRADLYLDGQRHDWPDNALRFAFLCRGTLEGAARLLGGPPDVFHVHDWQASLLPVYLRTRYADAYPDAASVLTIHNLAYQGLFPATLLGDLDLDLTEFTPECLEFHGWLNLLKGGVAFSDAVTTVSPTYAREILTPAFGNGLDGFLARYARRLRGIVNGIAALPHELPDPCTGATADADPLAAKARCRQALAQELDLRLTEGEALLGVVSRLDPQKGLDLVADMAPRLPQLSAHLVLLGEGSTELEERFRSLAATSGHVHARLGFDSTQAPLVLGGADVVLVPSRFEPCGLTQQLAMAWGTPPVVHAVGGLRDTVDDPGDDALARGEGTGFVFGEPTAEALEGAVRRALRLMREDPAGWRRLGLACLARDGSWTRPGREYLDLFREVAAGGPADRVIAG